MAVGCFAGGVDIVIDVLLDCEFYRAPRDAE
jgi:hypothetical protein